MQINSLYNNSIQSKTGILLPVTKNGRTIESKYNPEKEADNLINSINEEYGLFVIMGVGSGLLLSKLSQKFPKSKIIGLETTIDDIKFISKLNKINNNENIILCDILSIQKSLMENYVPSLHGNLKIIEILGWINENKDYIPYIKEQINFAISKISSDFSVQAHFGKIWQKNILSNIQLLNNKAKISTNKKKCVVLAAGPSLDNKIHYLRSNISDLFLISTDTAYSTLLKFDIHPEIVITLDGQFVSHNHFMHSNISNKTLFLADLCAESSILRNLPKNQLIFFASGHPLSSLINQYLNNSLLELYSGTGTVTIAAVDLAIKLQFPQFEVLGADFSYINGKTYASGTYLDTLYNLNTNKISSTEYLYSKLQFRTELQKIDKNIKTTEILNSYKLSFEEYLSQYGFDFLKENDSYKIKTNFEQIKNFNYSINCNIIDFYKYAQKNYELNNYFFLLPYVSYLRTTSNNSNFETLLKLAHSSFVRYNSKYEKK